MLYPGPQINQADLLNGSFTGNIIAPVNAGMSVLPRGGGAGIASYLPTTGGNPQTILLVWIVLFALLVGTHMLTLQVQR